MDLRQRLVVICTMVAHGVRLDERRRRVLEPRQSRTLQELRAAIGPVPIRYEIALTLITLIVLRLEAYLVDFLGHGKGASPCLVLAVIHRAWRPVNIIQLFGCCQFVNGRSRITKRDILRRLS